MAAPVTGNRQIPFILSIREIKNYFLTINQPYEISSQKIFNMKNMCMEYFTSAWSVKVKQYCMYILGVSWVTLL